MGEARRARGNGLMVPDTRLVDANGAPIRPGLASEAAQRPDYALVLIENGRVVAQRGLADPFIKVQITVKGWKKAWRVLRGQFSLEVQVFGTEQAVRHVMGPAARIRP